MNSIESDNLVNQKGWIAVDMVATTNEEFSVPITEIDKKKCASKVENWWYFGSKSKIESEEDQKKLSESLWEKFARTTTGHGFARMVDKDEPLKCRIFWVVVVTFLTIGLFTSVFIVSYDTLIIKEVRREFIVQHNSSLNLPDIHICDTSLFNVTVLRGLGFNDSLASYIALALSPHLASHGLQQDAKMRQELELDYRRLMKGKTIQDVFEKAVLKCEDIILGCTHNTIKYSSKHCCNRFFGTERYFTDSATLCISTHNMPPLQELFVSQIYGFTVYLKTAGSHTRFEFDPSIISSNVASRRGIIYAVSDRITTVNPAISTSGYYTTPGTWTSVSISLSRTDNTELSNGILSPYPCAPANSGSHLPLVPSYEVYSERNCVFASAHSVLEAKTNCSRFRFQTNGNHPPCEPKVMIDAYSPELVVAIKEKTNNCPQDCIFDDYQVSSSTTYLHLGDHDDMHEDEEHDDSIFHTAIHFFYPSFKFTIIKNHPQSIVKWLSEVGGNMSLFVGASFVTLLEIAVLIIHFFHLYFLGRRAT